MHAPIAMNGTSAAPPSRPHDLELMHDVARGAVSAQRALATRFVLRVRRSAHALMGGSPFADDAAQLTLVELLRSAHAYRTDVPLERWVDFIIARSVVSFARAVRRREPSHGAGDEPGFFASDAQLPRTLDEFLHRLPVAQREVLVLKHALGHGVDEIAEITHASPSTVRDRLLSARRDLRKLMRRDDTVALPGGTMNTVAERWSALRDREAAGEPLTEHEVSEAQELERSEPMARAHAAQLAELERHVHGRATDVPSARDRELVDRALDAVQVTSQPLRTRPNDPDADLSSAIDPEGPRWIRSGSIGLSVLLAVAALVALVTYEPPAAPPARTEQGATAQVPAPTVEALTTARTARRGGRLRRAGKVLGPDEALSAGDVLRAAEKPACLQLEPGTTVCLAPLSAVRLASLALKASALEVLEGRAIATLEGGAHGFELSAGPVHVSADAGIFGLERSESDRGLRVRVLEGLVHVSSPFGVREVQKGQMAVVHQDASTFTVEAMPDGQAQREWELRSTAVPPSASSPAATR